MRINLHNLEDGYKSILQNEYSYYLSDQMMFKVDRASMANSLEVRSPLVDNKLIEYIFSHTTEYIESHVDIKDNAYIFHGNKLYR